MFEKKLHINLLLILVCSQLMLTAGNFNDLSSLEFYTINQKNGLASNNVECILKDSDGFMWFGTRNGLCRFDGYQITTYSTTDFQNSLSGNRILCIAEDKDHNLWVGTYNNGVNKFNKRKGTFEHYGQENSIGDRVNAIKILADQSIWICSNEGLSVYQNSSNDFKSYKADPENPQALPSKIIYDLFETRLGDLYVTCESDDIFRFNRAEETFKPINYQRNAELKTNYNKQIAEDNSGNLWIAANSHGLSCYNPQNGESKLFTKAPGELNTNLLTGDIVKGPDGKIWVCTDGSGINVVDPLTYEFDYLENSETTNKLTSNTFYTAFFDEEERLWLGSFDEGVFVYDPKGDKFKATLYRPNDLKLFRGKSVISLMQDSDRRIWLGTDGNGLYRIDINGSVKHYQHQAGESNSLSSNVITSLGEAPSEEILIGTYVGGLNILNVKTGRFSRYLQKPTANEKINSTSIWNICSDSRGKVWLGLLADGLALFDPQSVTFENLGPSSNSPLKVNFPNVMAILEDSDGDIWFGTEGKGIFILDRQTNQIIKPMDDSVRHISTQGIIKCIYQDHWENVWIGTEGQGLFRYHKPTKQFVQLSTANGLPSNIIQSIIEDQNGNLWLGTSNGLSVMNSSTFKFNNFIESDGLSGNEFNQNAVIKLYDSRIMIGTSKGLNVFDPAKVEFNQQLPAVVFTKLIVLNKEIVPGEGVNKHVVISDDINETDEIRLTYKEKSFTIEFAALNYTLPEKCNYAYKLEAYDDNWNYTDARHRMASYSNLSAGTYKFIVKASNNDDLWGDNQKSVKIVILPPFYKTLWFRIILLSILLAIIYFIYNYRLNILRNRFMKKQIEQERKIMSLENEKLEAELQKLTFHIMNRNRALIDQKNRLLGLSSKAKESVRNGIKEIIRQFDEELTDDKDWKYMEPQLDKVYNNFVSKLKELHPDLTLTEIKIAAYVRMNLTTKEITEFMHKTPRAVENDRYRLRKKIGLNTNDSLQQYLMNI